MRGETRRCTPSRVPEGEQQRQGAAAERGPATTRSMHRPPTQPSCTKAAAHNLLQLQTVVEVVARGVDDHLCSQGAATLYTRVNCGRTHPSALVGRPRMHTHTAGRQAVSSHRPEARCACTHTHCPCPHTTPSTCRHSSEMRGWVTTPSPVAAPEAPTENDRDLTRSRTSSHSRGGSMRALWAFIMKMRAGVKSLCLTMSTNWAVEGGGTGQRVTRGAG